MPSGDRVKRPVRVTIFNQSYNLLASEEPGLTELLAQYVDDLMNTIAAKVGGADSTRVAVLASLHLADRVHHAERELSQLKERVADLSRRCEKLLAEAEQEPSSGDSGAG